MYSMERAVLEARDALESAGHQVCIVWRELSLRQEMPLSQSHTHNLQLSKQSYFYSK